IYYNPWTDLDFDQIDQKPIPNVLPIEENLPTEQEALQSIFTQPDNTEDIDDSQDPWEIVEETVIASGDIQHFLYPNLPLPLQNLNKDFYKLCEAKTKKAQDRLLKQVQRKVKLCQNMKIKGFVLTE
ncbi:7350_t:CDS:2, partial [Racocetra fulgida]